jgi:sulfur dioxygenase
LLFLLISVVVGSVFLFGRCSTAAALMFSVPAVRHRDFQQIKELGLSLKYVVNTHIHADHITGSGQLKQRTEGCQSIIASKAGDVKADIHLNEFDFIQFGSRRLYLLSTPGHTEVRLKDRCFVF